MTKTALSRAAIVSVAGGELGVYDPCRAYLLTPNPNQGIRICGGSMPGGGGLGEF